VDVKRKHGMANHLFIMALCSLLLGAGPLAAQVSIDSMLQNSDRPKPGSGVGAEQPPPPPASGGMPSVDPEPEAPRGINEPARTPADMAQAGAVDPDRSWAWVLARPGSVDDGHVLLAADGPSRAVFVLAWNAEGRVTTFGASPDARGQAGGDLATRMAAQPSQDPPPEGRYWGSWSTIAAAEGAAAQSGNLVWAQRNSALRAAVEGERTRARPIPTNGAQALLIVFPMPEAVTVTSWDVEDGADAQTALQKPLAYLTQGPTPAPYAPLLARPMGWDGLKEPGAWAFYKDASGRGWVFTVVDL
jgi:hypothetical protein